MATHPTHPMLVHFPIACWSLATLADVTYLFKHSDHIMWFAAILLGIGSLMAFAAMLAGLIDLDKIPQQSPAAKIVGYHISAVTAAWVMYMTSLVLRVNQGQLIEPGMLALALSFAAFICLSVGGWFGAQMVYQHGVGVQKNKKLVSTKIERAVGARP